MSPSVDQVLTHLTAVAQQASPLDVETYDAVISDGSAAALLLEAERERLLQQLCDPGGPPLPEGLSEARRSLSQRTSELGELRRLMHDLRRRRLAEQAS